MVEMRLRGSLAKAYLKEKALRRAYKRQAIIWALLCGVAFVVGMIIGG